MPKKNAFSVFVDENFRKMGISRVEAFGALGPKWSRMSTEERAPYEEKAGKIPKGPSMPNNYGNTYQNSNAYIRDNLTNSGATFEEIERQQRKTMVFKRDMMYWIDRNAVRATSVDGPKELYIACMKKHAKTHTGIVVPAEIAIVRFNLVEGVKEVCSFIIRNNEKWVKENAPAYQFKMFDRARNSHSIPVSQDFPLAESIDEVVEKLTDFMRTSSSENSLPPLFALNRITETVDHIVEDNMDDMKIALEYLFENSGTSMKPPLVYDFLELFHKMYKVLMEKGSVAMINPSMIREVLKQKVENDRYLLEQTGGDCCRFHYELSETMDFNVDHCALATAKRWVYLMCDHLSQGVFGDSGYSPEYGRHVPPKNETIGIGTMGSNITQMQVQKALKMSIVKEYANAISGVKTTAFGSMNGTTLLPTDKDPAIEVARQIKKSMADLKLDDLSKEDDATRYYSVNEDGPVFRSGDFPSLGGKDERDKLSSTKSSDTKDMRGSSKTRSIRNRLGAKFDSPSDKSSQYQSFD